MNGTQEVIVVGGVEVCAAPPGLVVLADVELAVPPRFFVLVVV